MKRSHADNADDQVLDEHRQLIASLKQLNSQFARWVAQQEQEAPCELWTAGASDYITHVKKLLANYAGVLGPDAPAADEPARDLVRKSARPGMLPAATDKGPPLFPRLTPLISPASTSAPTNGSTSSSSAAFAFSLPSSSSAATAGAPLFSGFGGGAGASTPASSAALLGSTQSLFGSSSSAAGTSTGLLFGAAASGTGAAVTAFSFGATASSAASSPGAFSFGGATNTAGAASSSSVFKIPGFGAPAADGTGASASAGTPPLFGGFGVTSTAGGFGSAHGNVSAAAEEDEDEEHQDDMPKVEVKVTADANTDILCTVKARVQSAEQGKWSEAKQGVLTVRRDVNTKRAWVQVANDVGQIVLYAACIKGTGMTVLRAEKLASIRAPLQKFTYAPGTEPNKEGGDGKVENPAVVQAILIKVAHANVDALQDAFSTVGYTVQQ